MVHIYVEHVEQAVKEKVDEDQGNEGDDEHEFHKEVDEGVGVDDGIGVDDNFFWWGICWFGRWQWIW